MRALVPERRLSPADRRTATSRLAGLLALGLLAGSFSAAPRSDAAGLGPAPRLAPAATPAVSLALAHDTGRSASDGITSDPTVSGSLTGGSNPPLLLAAIDPTNPPRFVNLGSSVQPDGRFTLTRAQLDALAHGTLAQGPHTLLVQVPGAAGSPASSRLDFTLDSQAPALAGFALALASDTAPIGDGRTSVNPVTLQGSAEPGAGLALRRDGSDTVLGTTTAAGDGSFAFAGVTLVAGANAFTASATDAAGNAASAGLVVTSEADSLPDTLPPTLAAALQHDTGPRADDGVTSDPGIAGNAFDDVGVTQLLAQVDPDAPGSTAADVSAQLQPDGSFVLARTVLDVLAGGALADGRHTLRLVAKDAAANASPARDVVFTLDTRAPTGASFGISPVDAFGGNDAQSAAAVVVLRGSAEPGASIALAAQGLASTASATGAFQLPGVALAPGDNALVLTVADTAGNGEPVARTLTRVQATQGDAVLDWITTALGTIQRDATHPQVATRTLAIQSIAVHDSLAAIQGTPAFLVQRGASGAADAQAAAAQAAWRVLSQLYPGQRASLDAALATSLAKLPEGAAKAAGIALGDTVAQAVLAIRANDGYLDFAADDGSTALGQWRATAPMFLVPEEPQWGRVTPFALDSGAQFRAAPPPALDAPAYAAAINEVQALGSAASSARSADQSLQAQFWADGSGSFTPPGHWDQIAVQVALARGLSPAANARLMAELNVALADAAIAAWDTKYAYAFWRPITAIHEADRDGNPATAPDAGWTPLLVTPAHPSYVSGHSSFSAAAAAILGATFGDATAFTATSSTLPGVTRSFASFGQAADEAGLSRVYGGIHTRLDNEAGKLLGSQVGQAVLARFALTADTQPPHVVLAALPAATHANLAIAGQVLDNLSGVAAASIAVDGGAPQALALDAAGNFAFTTTLATDGSADGAHAFAVTAVDTAGNATAPTARAFTLGTQPPTLVLGSLADGDVLSAASRLAGSARPHAGVLVQLGYQIDAAGVRALPFGADGSFDSPIAFGTQPAGTHALVLTARDDAGNTATLARSVRVDAPAPFALAGTVPGDGSVDIGVTQRPLLRFTRPVDPATLTAASLYATGPDGSRLPATIVPAADASFAWLFFAAPMPGAARVALHVDGGMIRAAADGAFLDADGDGNPGGTRTIAFTTVNRAPVAGTRLVGKVVDPGPDLKPMTFDDIRRGPDGVIETADDVFLLPIAGARVYLLGREDQVAATAADGSFELDGVPAGDVKVVVDGRTATNAPSGVFFPEMVIDARLQAGVANTVMGSMGSVEEALANTTRGEIYLPRVNADVMQSLSDTQSTTVRIDDPAAAPQLTDAQRAQLTLTVDPGSALGADGRPLAQAQLGISTVAPELVKDMLPAGVLQHTFDITIQAPGVAAFAKPARISFPNVFNAPAGAKLGVLSFDHTTGKLVIDGSATVTPDGTAAVSDTDSGIRAPGWHGLTPPGGCAGSGGPPPAPVGPAGGAAAAAARRRAQDASETVTFHPPVVLPLITGSASIIPVRRKEWEWTAPPAVDGGGTGPGDPGGGCQVPTHPAPAPGVQPSLINVTIDIDGPLADFAQPLALPNATSLTSDTFTLTAGSGASAVFGFLPLPYTAPVPAMKGLFGPANADPALRSFLGLTADQLYGAKITVNVFQQSLGGLVRTRDIYTYYQYRWVDVIDAERSQNKIGDTAAFLKTWNDGPGGFVRSKSVRAHLPSSVATRFLAPKPFIVDGAPPGESTLTWKFDPENSVLFPGSPLQIDVDDPAVPDGGLVGTLQATGLARGTAVVGIDQDALASRLNTTVDALQTMYTRLPNKTLGPSFVVYPYPGRVSFHDEDEPGHGRIHVKDDLAHDGTDFATMSESFRNTFAGFMPADRRAGPDGVAGTVDDAFDPIQEGLLTNKAAAVAGQLLPFVVANFSGIIGDQLRFQPSKVGASVFAKWADVRDNTSGHMAFGETDKPIDNDLDGMHNDIGTLHRTDPGLPAPIPFEKEIPDAAQAWALSQFMNVSDTGVLTLAVPLTADSFNPDVSFLARLGYVFSHELAHTLGLNEGYLPGSEKTHDTGGTAGVRADGQAPPFDDIMNAGTPDDGAKKFHPPLTNLLKAAVGIAPDDPKEMSGALTYWRDHFNLAPRKDGFGFKNGRLEFGLLPLTTPEVALRTPDTDYFGSGAEQLAFGSVAADGAGAATRDVALQIVNQGTQPLVLASVALSSGQAFSLIGAPGAGTSIAPGAQLPLTLRFDPLAAGDAADQLLIETNAGTVPHFVLALEGTGTRTAPSARFARADNNLGGLTLDAAPATAPAVFTLTNDGLQPLVISGATMLEGANAFTLVGLPVDLDAHPVTLATGEQLVFGASFKPDRLGLRRALVDLVTNDPDQPKLRLSVVGTGVAAQPIADWGNDYVAIDNPGQPDTPALRTVSDATGQFSVFLDASTPYHVAIFDPATGLVAHGSGLTSLGGQGTDLTATLVFLASTAKDSDFDGLPDDIESAIGSSPVRRDSDLDGIDDFTEIAQGSDPLGALRVPTGIMSTTALQGSAQAVAVVAGGSTGAGITAVLAAGSGGVAIVDASQPSAPKVLGQLALPGNAVDVAVDATRNLAAVAGEVAGLHIVDIANPAAPRLRQTVPSAASITHVRQADGIAYATAGTAVLAVDLDTGEPGAELDLGGTTLLDIALAGRIAVTVDDGGRLHTLAVDGEVLTPLGTLALPPVGGGQLFIAGGVAYVAAGNGGTGGYLSVDVSDPAHPALLSGIDDNAIAGTALALNGSGLAVAVGSSAFVVNPFRALDVIDATDPTATGRLVTRIDLPDAPRDVALAAGLAFVADGASGLLVVNYLGADVQGVAPTVAIAVDAVDADATTPGLQVLEGRGVRVLPTVVDDVQVRSVELLVDGQVAATALTYPFELFAPAPPIAAGGTRMTLQVRATDTGGNASLSAVQVVDVVPDAVAPTLVASSVDEGARLHFVRVIALSFDEPLDLARFTSAGVTLVGAGADGLFGTADDVPVATSVDARVAGQQVSVLAGDFLPPGDYTLDVPAAAIADLAGNVAAAPVLRHFTILPAANVRAASGTPASTILPSANPGQPIALTVPFDAATARATFHVVDTNGSVNLRTVGVFSTDATRRVATFVVPADAVSGDMVVFSQVGDVVTNFPDGTMPLQVLPTVSGVQVESISADASSAQLLLAGTGFVEGAGSVYRFGTTTVVDADSTTGPDVLNGFDTARGVPVPNGNVRLTVSLADGSFGPISVRTAGGTSAPFVVTLAGIESVALSGTPADASQASANAGQSVLLHGAGLSTATGVLLRYTDNTGVARRAALQPASAAADGSSAALALPAFANGAAALQVFGSASQPLLQLVPTLSGADILGRTTLTGSGFVEAASSYAFAGASVADTPADTANNIDVGNDSLDQNRSVSLTRTALPVHGLGSVTATTLAGTSAPFALNTIRVDVPVSGTSLGDVAVDPISGALWVSDQASPGHLLRIDPATGRALQTITLTAAFGSTQLFNNAGLQVLAAPMTLGTTSVPAGSLLVFNGSIGGNDRVVAVEPASGNVIASLTLDARYSLTAGVFDAANGHFFIAEGGGAGNRIVEIDAATGIQLGAATAPFSVQSAAGLALDPATGHLWLGALAGGSKLAELRIDGIGALTLLRTLDAAPQHLDQNEVSGLAFAPDGSLRVASTQGEVYRIDPGADGLAVPTATLARVIATARAGVPASAAQASANVGQAIDLVGTGFGPGTRVLFDIRDNAGNTRVVAQPPSLVDASGTRLQVPVPDLATTGDVRVVNQGTRDLGFSTFTDAVYRNVSLDFVAAGTGATITFSDAGLSQLAFQSWGLDNVAVRDGGTLVFADDFESASAAPQWSDRSIDAEAVSTFGHFSGRFSSTRQQLALQGLASGHAYTLSFDLLVFDSWHGSHPTNGPTLIDVAIDGTSRLHETFSSDASTDSAQSFRASVGIRLQVVPTLTARVAGTPFTPPALIGSGFMEGASVVTIGGTTLPDDATNLANLDVGGARNDNLALFVTRTLDGPIRVATEGGSAEIAGGIAGSQDPVVFTRIDPVAAPGQTVALAGAGFSGATQVLFPAQDDSGALGVVSVSGLAAADGRTLSVTVPVLARSGVVGVTGSATTLPLKIVPALRALGGTVVAGNTIVLEGTGLAASDLRVAIDGRGVGGVALRHVVDGQEFATLTVPPGIGPGLVTVTTDGGLATLRAGADGFFVTALPPLLPQDDVGDTLATALDTGLGLNQSIGVSADIPAATPRDVDLVRVALDAQDQLAVRLSTASGTSLVLRIFDAGGQALFTQAVFPAAIATLPLRWQPPGGGTFYIGLSGSGNAAYDPVAAGSGSDATSFGSYTLLLERTLAGSRHIGAITAMAGSGTPALAGLPSANAGQTITLAGAGLVTGDRLVFTSRDTVNAFPVTPVLDLAHQTMTAVVPANAVTGGVRLERDGSGAWLQVVPTLSGASMPAGTFTSGSLQLAGSGLSIGAVVAGDRLVSDFDADGSGTAIALTVPSGLPAGPLAVSTAGGRSAPLGIAFTGMAATCASGIPADPAHASANTGQTIALQGSGLSAASAVVFPTMDAVGNAGDQVVRVVSASPDGRQAQVVVPANALSGDVRVLGAGTGVRLQIVATISDVQVQSIASDGTSAQLLLTGTGFVEGGGSEYRIGAATIVDAGNSGPDVSNGTVRLNVPLVDGVFGPVSVRTAGGTSAGFSVTLAGVDAVALSGTPADPDQASANASQAVTLHGAGLAATTDVLLRFTDNAGVSHRVQLSPTSAAADGSSATLAVPAFANGAATLQVFGSASQPLLQVVPTLSGADIQGRTVLSGSGLVEGAATYAFAGASVADTPADTANNVDVGNDSLDQNRSVSLTRTALPAHGLGSVTATTLAGTSAPFALNTIRVDVPLSGPSLGDVAVDPAGGDLWVSDQASPAHLLRIDPATGRALQTITLTTAFGSTQLFNNAGLQVLAAPMTLGTTSVPAGSLLVFNGSTGGNDRVVAVEPASGNVIASLTLDAHYSLTAGVFDATNNHLYLAEGGGAGNRVVELSAVTGALLGAATAPFSVQSAAGLALDPASGHLWLGALAGGSKLAELRIDGIGALTLLRTLDATPQRLDQNEVSGLAFAPDGSLRVASTQGEVYRILVGQ